MAFPFVTLLRAMSQCANFAGMGNDNKGNRIAFGTPTTDYGFSRENTSRDATPTRSPQAGHRARTTLHCIIGFVVGCAAGAALEVKFDLWTLVLPVALGVIAIPLSELRSDDSSEWGSVDHFSSAVLKSHTYPIAVS